MSASYVDVLIIGAGLSGIGAACHLKRHSPQKSFAIVESRDSFGGTWDLFRYPGIRSDSDMYTFGYTFKPWIHDESISSGDLILRYLQETISENNLNDHIDYATRVEQANWSSSEARWTVTVINTKSLERKDIQCRFLFGCTGYYRYSEGYCPAFKGRDEFKGQLVHPQFWPQNLDWKNKRIVVIGSGATAMTLVPALAKDAAHVTMLQRSPTYVVSKPRVDRIARFFRRVLPSKLAYAATRAKNILEGMVLFSFARRFPNVTRRALVRNVEEKLRLESSEIRKHFKPTYNPWDQRICLVPDDDLFEAINSESVSVVTSGISRFTSDGITLDSSDHLPADIIVTATGLQIDVFSGISVRVDDVSVNTPDTYCYKGMMLSGVPNMAFSIGYTNASWTLKSDLVAEYVCRLINFMDKHSYDTCRATAVPEDITEAPLMEFTSGYVERARHLMPKQGTKKPWRLYQNYVLDRISLRYGSVKDKVMTFSRVSK